MITKNPRIDDLIIEIKSKYKFENVNKQDIIQPYLLETQSLVNKALFLKNKADYLYCLSQYGDFCVYTEKYSILLFGFGAWDGSAIEDYPLVDEDGMYVFADAQGEKDNVFLFAFNTIDMEDNMVWIANEEGGAYSNTNCDFNTFLEYMLADSFEKFL